MIPARFRDFLFRSIVKRRDARRRTLKQRFSTESLERKALLTTFTVTNTDDAGAGSLRDAIELANGNLGTSEDPFDTIEFAEGLTGTITLSSELLITDSVDIFGPGSDLLTITVDETVTSRIFNIEEDQFQGDPGDPTADPPILPVPPAPDIFASISGFTLTGGTADDGGAIRNYFAEVYIADTVLTGNSATRGGAIYTEGFQDEPTGYGGEVPTAFIGDVIAFDYSELYLENVTVDGNTATDGGGIYNNFDHVELFESAVTNNYASGSGGGIHTIGSGFGGEGGPVGTLLINDSEIRNNTADFNGGGIYNENDHVELNDGSSLSNNNAVQRGGGIYTFADDGFIGTTFQVSESEVSGNRAAHGGGVYGADDYLRFYRAIVSNNQAIGISTGTDELRSGIGGGVFNAEGEFGNGYLSIEESTFTGNIARAGDPGSLPISNGWGGAIFSDSSGFIQESTFSGNSAEDGDFSGFAAGGAIVNNGFLSIENSTISGNWSEGVGGGFAGTDNGSSTIRSSTITNNRADAQNQDTEGNSEGGGVFTAGNTVRLDNTILAGNFGTGGATDDGADTSSTADAVTADHALIGDVTGLFGISNGVDGNIVGDSTTPVDPLLGPLQDNAGPTQTHALLAGSPAIDAGDTFEFRDQRGNERDILEDIGAYEVSFDFGDAPQTFPVRLDQDGARHLVGGLYLGSAIDGEPDGQPSTNASGDDNDGPFRDAPPFGRIDDEDGIRFVLDAAPLDEADSLGVAGFSGRVEVTASGTGLLSAWIDSDGDGAWDPTTEQFLTDVQVFAGPNLVDFTLPGLPTTIAVEGAAVRFRLSTQAGLAPTGDAPDGEVEDYLVRAEPIVLPDGTTEDGGFVFVIVTPPRVRRWFDPDVAIGYDYEVNTDGAGNPLGDLFTSVELAHGFGDDIYTLEFIDGAGVMQVVTLGDFEPYDFEDPAQGNTPGGVSYFRISGIEVEAGLDPDDDEAFPTNIAFGDADENGSSEVNFTMTALATPVADDDGPFEVLEDQELDDSELSVLDNDTDRNPDDELTAELVDDEGFGPFNGTVELNEDGTFVYTPDPDYFGPDEFTYRAFDGLGYSDPATVFIEVVPVNDAPVAENGFGDLDEDTTLQLDLLSLISDIDNGAEELGVVLTSGPEFGSFETDEVGNLFYRPDGDFFGEDSFTFRGTDGNLDSIEATFTFNVQPVNDAPTAEDGGATTDEDIAVEVDLDSLIDDIDSEGIEAIIVSGPSHGTLDEVEGTLVYTPNPDFNGSDEIVFRAIDDGELESANATFTITITPVNDAPVAGDDDAGTDEDTPVVVDLLNNDGDVDNEISELTVGIVSGPTNGSFEQDPETGVWTYTPAPNYFSPEELPELITYELFDPAGAVSNVATITIVVAPVNDAPVAVDDNETTNQGVPVTVLVVDNDTDVEQDVLTPQIVSQPANGTAVVDDGTIIYTPNAGFTGEDSFTYLANDGTDDSNIATVTVTVNGGQAGPVRVDDGTSFETIQAALDHAADVAGPNTIEVDPGVYREDLVIADSEALILVGLTGVGEEGEGDGIVRIAGDGDGSAPIIQINQLSDVTLQNILVRNSSGDAIQATAATDPPAEEEDGEDSDDVPTLTLIDVSLLNNDGDGLNVEGPVNVDIQGGRFNNNDGDGIDLSGVGDVEIVDSRANGNDPGLLINGAASVSVSGSFFNNNADGGIVLIDIAGDVDIFTTVTNNNDADGDNDGDGIRAVDGADADDLAIGGSLEVSDSRMQDTDGADSVRNQVYGLHVPDGAGINVILTDNTATGNEQDGARIVGTRGIAGVLGGTYSRNRDDGVRILRTGTPDAPASFFTVYVAELTANGNGEDGVDIDRVAGNAVVVEVRANDNGHDGVQMDYVRDIAGVGGVTTNNNGEEGIDIEHSAFTEDAFVIVIDSTADNNGADGIEIGRVGDVQIVDVRANSNGDEGLDIERAGEVLIEGSRFNINTNDGIEMDRIAALEMDEVRSNGNGEDGIDVETVSGDVVVTNTIANGNADEGIQIFGVGGTTSLESVTASSNGDRGLWIRSAHDVSVTDSVFNANDTRGADIERACNVILTGVRANNNDSDGVRLYRVWDVEIDDSRANGNGVDGFHIDRARDVSVSNTRAQQNGDDGFQVFNSRDVEAIDSFFSRNDDDGFQVINSRDITLERVTADRNGDDGIQVRNSGDVTATDSKARRNGDDGLQIINSGVVIISGGIYSGNGDDDISVF